MIKLIWANVSEKYALISFKMTIVLNPLLVIITSIFWAKTLSHWNTEILIIHWISMMNWNQKLTLNFQPHVLQNMNMPGLYIFQCFSQSATKSAEVGVFWHTLKSGPTILMYVNSIFCRRIMVAVRLFTKSMSWR